MLYDELIAPLLFLQDPERAHERVLVALQHLPSPPAWLPQPSLPTRFLRRELLNPIGLAAGLDKNASCLGAWSWLGFGLVEVGTLVPQPQAGNSKPRLFRLPEAKALINAMGFNSLGVDVARQHLLAGPSPATLLLNIGKNATTPIAAADQDLCAVIAALKGLGHGFVMNVSSPNTAQLRELQAPQPIRALVEACVREAQGTPVLVKMTADLPPSDLDASVDAALQGGAAGLILSNTTVARPLEIQGHPHAVRGGGLSGAPLKEAATRAIAQAYRHTRGRVPLVGVGGIATPQDVWEKMAAGADVVQIYTALIYQGPLLPRRLVAGLRVLMEIQGMKDVSQIAGCGLAVPAALN